MVLPLRFFPAHRQISRCWSRYRILHGGCYLPDRSVRHLGSSQDISILESVRIMPRQRALAANVQIQTSAVRRAISVRKEPTLRTGLLPDGESWPQQHRPIPPRTAGARSWLEPRLAFATTVLPSFEPHQQKARTPSWRTRRKRHSPTYAHSEKSNFGFPAITISSHHKCHQQSWLEPRLLQLFVASPDRHRSNGIICKATVKPCPRGRLSRNSAATPGGREESHAAG